MRHRGLLIGAIALLLVGTGGLLALAVLAPPAGVTRPLAPNPRTAPAFASVGQQIYLTGTGQAGPIPRSIAGGGMGGFGMMGDFACVDCHGAGGRGGRVNMMMGVFDVPDIRYDTLTTAHSEGGERIEAWTDADIATAIRDGLEPGGRAFTGPMPRWAMTDADVRATIDYLKELSRR